MAYPPLTQDSDLASFPGAPFADAVIRAAERSIRNECSWHIAPVITETVKVKCWNPWRLVLRSLRVVSVTSVTGDDSVAVTGYTLDEGSAICAPPHSWFNIGHTYTVVVTHGYDDASDLLPVVAARCLRQVTDPTLSQRSETVGQRTSSESYNVNRNNEELGAGHGSPIDRYKIVPVG